MEAKSGEKTLQNHSYCQHCWKVKKLSELDDCKVCGLIKICLACSLEMRKQRNLKKGKVKCRLCLHMYAF